MFRGPRSPMKLAVATLLTIGVVYYFLQAPTTPSSTTPVGSTDAAANARSRPQAAAVAGQVNDAEGLGFKPVREEEKPKWVPVGPPTEEGVKKGANRGRLAQEAGRIGDIKPVRKGDLSGENPPLQAVRKKLVPVDEGDEALARAARKPDRREDMIAENGEEEEEKKVVKRPPVDNDDLDGAQNKKGMRKGKKLLGGAAAWRAAGGAAGAVGGAAVGADKEKWGGGWNDRFKQKAMGGAADPNKPNPAVAPPPPRPKDPILSHPLVARAATLDLSRDGKGRVVVNDDEDSFQADPKRPKVDLTASDYNLTVCALIQGETRFLNEWLLYHKFLGVDRFILYDTAVAGSSGSAEIDGLADRMEAEGKGEMRPKADEVKAMLGMVGAGGLDERGIILPERIAGLENWIEQKAVVVNHMAFKESKRPVNFHKEFLRHCTDTYSSSTNWLAHLDIDEFMTMSEPLYGPRAPYQDEPPKSRKSTPSGKTWRYPLHDLLGRFSIDDASCVVLSQLRYRNVGIRHLKDRGVLSTQTRRDTIQHGNSPEKTLIHTSYTKGVVSFDGPHTCKVDPTVEAPDGITDAIKNSQGVLLQEGGTYKSTRLPTEPLAIAHFLQRDLSDCHSKLSLLDDPNSLREKGRGTVICEEHYLPSQEELESEDFTSDRQNRFLVRVPAEGTVVEDLRLKQSFAAKAAAAVLTSPRWKKAPSEAAVLSARKKVQVLNF